MPPLDNRKTMHYPGDVTGDLGRLVGPTLSGEYLVLDEASYDAETDRTTARFRYAVDADFTVATMPLGGVA